MTMIRRVLMITQNRGKGVEGDPIRNVLFFFYEDTLELICEYDPYLETLAQDILNAKK